MDAYAYWREELDNPGCNPRDTNRRDLCGFYRIHKAKTKPDYPVAIWSDDDRLHVQLGRNQPPMLEPREGDDQDAEAWNRFFSTNWYHAKAIPEEQYRETMADGWWPFVDGYSKTAWAREDGQVFRVFGDMPTTPASEGGNMPPEEADSFDELRRQIERDANKIEAIGAIQTIEQARAYRALQDILNALHKKADAARVKEKRPHDEAAAAVQAKWKPVVDAAKKWADYARDTVDAWQKEQDRQARARAEEEAARIKAENERIANEHAEAVRLAERQAEEKADAGEFLPEVELPPEPELKPAPVAPPPMKVAGSPFSTARKARVIVTGEIVDVRKLVDFMLGQNDAGLLEYLQGRANAAAKAKLSLPGVVRKES